MYEITEKHVQGLHISVFISFCYTFVKITEDTQSNDIVSEINIGWEHFFQSWLQFASYFTKILNLLYIENKY